MLKGGRTDGRTYSKLLCANNSCVTVKILMWQYKNCINSTTFLLQSHKFFTIVWSVLYNLTSAAYIRISYAAVT